MGIALIILAYVAVLGMLALVAYGQYAASRSATERAAHHEDVVGQLMQLIVADRAASAHDRATLVHAVIARHAGDQVAMTTAEQSADLRDAEARVYEALAGRQPTAEDLIDSETHERMMMVGTA